MTISCIIITIIVPRCHFKSQNGPKQKEMQPESCSETAWSHLALTATESQPDISIMALLSSITGKQDTKRLNCWEHMPYPTPLWWVRVQSAHVELARGKLGFQGDAGARSASSTPPMPLPLSPNLWDLTVLLSCDSIVSWQSLYTNKPDSFNAIVSKMLPL